MTLGGGFAALAAATLPPLNTTRATAMGITRRYNNNVTQIAAQQCQAAVQNRLSYRTNNNGILGAILGTSTSGRVLA
jgi:hypothetical protein